MMWRKLIGLALLPVLAHSFASTDSLQDADPPQSGYLPNHNMDPSTVASSLTAQWKLLAANAQEIFYAKPLVFTPPGAAHEQVVVVSNQNVVRVLDGITGALINSRTLQPAFTAADSGCGDIQFFVGITGTPVIDPSTNIMYLFSKGYLNGKPGSQGTINGAYRFYAIKLPTLEDAFPPTLIDGHFADNDHTRYFVGGTLLQRPGLAMLENSVVAGFGGHCDKWNYTGMAVAVSKTTGSVTGMQAMVASPGAPSPQALDISVEGNGKAGIWHSGMGIAADNNRVFFVTGNGRGAGQNGGHTGAPASGKTYLSTLEQCVVDMSVSASGSLTQADYFEPYAYDSLNGGDRDFGSSGVALLDPATFSGGGVNRVAVAGGKDGHIYIMDADNLGGFGGNSGVDNVIQTITNTASLLSGVASYPLEGGYIYFCPSGSSLYAYKLTKDNQGKPNFVLAGKSAAVFNGRTVPVVTSNKGKAGSGIVWLADGNAGLVAFNAVPVGGVLQQIKLPTSAATGGAFKMQRAVFGNSRVYMVSLGKVTGLGTSTISSTAALTATPSSIDFGSVSDDDTKTISVTLSASDNVKITGCSTSSALFQCGASGFPITITNGGSITVPVTFNLSDANLIAWQNAGHPPVTPGSLNSLLNIAATDSSNSMADVSVPLTGTAVTNGGYLVANQTTIDFGAASVGGPTISRSVILSNDGTAPLTFKGFAYQDYYGGMVFVNVTSSTVGVGYTSPNFPALQSQIQPGASITVQLVFKPTKLGIAASYLTLWSDGGYTDILMTGNAQTVASSSSSSSMLASSSVISSSSSSLLSSSSSVTSSVLSSSSDLSLSTDVSSSSTSSVDWSSTLSSSTDSGSSTVLSFTSSSDVASSTLSSDSGSSSAADSLSVISTDSSSSDPGTSTSLTKSFTSSSSLIKPSSTSSVGPSTNTASTTSSIPSTLSTSTRTIPTATASAIGGFTYQGCYRDLSKGHALPLLVSNKTVTPELCLALVQSLASKPTPTILPYFYLESHKECYGGSSFNWASSAVTSLTGTKACTDVCSGFIGAASTGMAKCGGSKMFNLYAASAAPTLSAQFTLTK